MSKKDSFKEGYNYFTEQVGSYTGSDFSRITNQPYLDNIQKEINALETAMNSYKGNGNPNLHGYLAEEWHAHTFNIDAAVKRTNEYAKVLSEEVNNLGSADIGTSWNENYGLKFYKNGEGSAMAQAKSVEERYREFIKGKENPPTREKYLRLKGLDPNTDMDLSLYIGQSRLIPSDQMQDAIIALKKQIAHDSCIPERQHLVAKYEETLRKLTDHIESPEGATSMRLTHEDSKNLQSLAKEGKFDPERYDITLAEKADKIFICQNALKAGLNAALTSAILKAIPHIISAIKKMVEDGYIEENDLEKIGKGAMSGAKEGFIHGLFCAAITSISEVGYLGALLQNASHLESFAPGLAVAIVLVKQAISDSIQMAKGEITAQEFCYKMEKAVFITVCGYSFGITLQSLIHIPVISYTIGSMVGSILGGLLYEVKEKFFMSLCVSNGYTFWGLVEQSYEMPAHLLKKLGYDIFEYEDFDYSSFEVNTHEYEPFDYEPFNYEKLDIIIMKRGIIGIRKIGYL